ncbi:nucleotide-binding alpha-beta plait domain-containing protein, partial [Tanacetum coccineum]
MVGGEKEEKCNGVGLTVESKRFTTPVPAFVFSPLGLRGSVSLMSAEIKNYLDKFYYEAPYVVFDASFYEVFVVPNKEDAIKKLEKIAGDGAILCLTKCVAKALKMKTSYCVPVHFHECGHSKPLKDMDCTKSVAESHRVYGNTIVATGNPHFYKQFMEIASIPVMHYDSEELTLTGPLTNEQQQLAASKERAAALKSWKKFKSRWKKREMASNRKMPTKREWLKRRLTPGDGDGKRAVIISHFETRLCLFEFFEVAGQIVKVEYAIISEKFAGYVLIHFATHDAARKALELSGHKMLSRVIRIEAPEDKVACRDGMKDSGGAWVCSAVFK